MKAKELKDKGIAKSLSNANRHSNKWSENAYKFLVEYCKTNTEFMTENVRKASVGKVEQPPSNRAWGGIIICAVKNGLIQRAGYKNTTNPKAHCTPATLWEVI